MAQVTTQRHRNRDPWHAQAQHALSLLLCVHARELEHALYHVCKESYDCASNNHTSCGFEFETAVPCFVRQYLNRGAPTFAFQVYGQVAPTADVQPPPPQIPFAAGNEVEVQSLSSEAGKSLNGARGLVLRYDDDSERYVVICRGWENGVYGGAGPCSRYDHNTGM